MKKIKELLLIGILLILNSFASGQSLTTYKELALNFSRLNAGGSARIQALGGAQVSLGGDYSSAYSNPAGLGMFHRSEFTVTPGFNSNNISSDYIDNKVKDSNSKIILPGISLVFHSPIEDRGNFLGGSFGISFNRTNNFNSSFTYEGVNRDNSIIDDFIEDANGFTTKQFDSNGSQYDTPTGLAYFNYLIDSQNNLDPPGSDKLYFTDIGSIPTQREQVLTQGSQSQVNLSYGANFGDKVFVGFGIGLTSLNYQSKKTYTESFTADRFLNKLTLIEDISTKGSGINATAGIIYKPEDFFQFGASITTPSAYTIADSYRASMSTNWKFFPYGAANQPTGEISTSTILTDYSLVTPWKFSGGGTFFIKKFGFITADVELLNYGGNSYSSSTTGVSFDFDNSQIQKLYKTTMNYRFGAEYRLKMLRFRGGFNLMPDPYKSVQNGVDNTLQSVSFGAGYKTAKFYIDVAAVLSQSNFSYRPYLVSSNLTPLVTAKQANTLVIVTLGFPF
jgi:hypothetical protein